jgi:hypothetical protein
LGSSSIMSNVCFKLVQPLRNEWKFGRVDGVLPISPCYKQIILSLYTSLQAATM